MTNIDDKIITIKHAQEVFFVHVFLTLIALPYCLYACAHCNHEPWVSLFTEQKPMYVLIHIGSIWALTGLMLFLCAYRKLTASNIVFWLTFFFCGLVFSIIMRDNLAYNDMRYYIQAAVNLSQGKLLPEGYIYPPLFATLLQPFVVFGTHNLGALWVMFNFISFMLMIYLLNQLLVRFDFSRNSAAVIVFVLLIINSPVLVSFRQAQVNFLLVDVFLLGVLFYPRRVILSGVCMAFAICLKVSPVVFVLLFILNRDYKWICSLLITVILIVIITSCSNSFLNYSVFGQNIADKIPISIQALRQNSIESFMNTISSLVVISPLISKSIIVTFKVAASVFTILILIRSIKTKAFFRTDQRCIVLYNGFIVMSFFMLIISPIIWPPHFVFVIPAFAVMLKAISKTVDLLLYLLSWLLMFVIPIFELYPFSYHGIVGAVLCYILMWRLSGNAENTETIVDKVKKYFYTEVLGCNTEK